MTKKQYLELLKKSAVDGTFPSYNDEEERCKYRCNNTPTSKKRCAIGLLIPDDKYDPTMEGHTLYWEKVLCKIEPVDGLCAADLSHIQGKHDTLANAGSWDSALFISEIEKLECFRE